jgi:hypothetical protein
MARTVGKLPDFSKLVAVYPSTPPSERQREQAAKRVRELCAPYLVQPAPGKTKRKERAA